MKVSQSLTIRSFGGIIKKNGRILKFDITGEKYESKISSS